MVHDAATTALPHLSEHKRRSRQLRAFLLGLLPALATGCPAFVDDPYVIAGADGSVGDGGAAGSAGTFERATLSDHAGAGDGGQIEALLAGGGSLAGAEVSDAPIAGVGGVAGTLPAGAGGQAGGPAGGAAGAAGVLLGGVGGGGAAPAAGAGGEATAGVGGEAEVSAAGDGGAAEVPVAGAGGQVGAAGVATAGDGGAVEVSIAGAGGLAGAGGTAAVAGGGAGGEAGAGGSGGSIDEHLIDDFEDGDLAIIEHDGRQGTWFDANDAAGTQTLAVVVDGPTGSTGALRSTGFGFNNWGASVQIDFNEGQTEAYDASAYSGITFWLQIAFGTTANIRFAVADRQTDPRAGYCADCYDNFGTEIVASTVGRQYSFTWAELRQEGWGTPLAFSLDPTALYGLQFVFDAGANFNVTIDDVAFIPSAGPPPPPGG